MIPSNLHPPSSPLPLNQIHTFEQLLVYLHHLSIVLNLNFSPSRPTPPPLTGLKIISAARSICQTVTTLCGLRRDIEQEICIRAPSDDGNGNGEVDLETRILFGFLDNLTDLEEGGVEGWVRWLETLKFDKLLEQSENPPKEAGQGEQRMGRDLHQIKDAPSTVAPAPKHGKIPHSLRETRQGEETTTRRRRPSGKDIAYLPLDERSKDPYDADDDATPPSAHAQPERRVLPHDVEADMRRRVASGYRYIPALVAGLPAVHAACFGPRTCDVPPRKEGDARPISRSTRTGDTERLPQTSTQRNDNQRRRNPALRAEKKRDFYRRLAEEVEEGGSSASFIEIERILRRPPPPSSPNDGDDEASGSLHIRRKPKMRGGMGSSNFYYNPIHDLWSREEQYSEPDQDHDVVEKKTPGRETVIQPKEEQNTDHPDCYLPRVPSLDWKEWKDPPIPTPRDSPPHSYAHSSPSLSPPKDTIEPGTIASTPLPLSAATAFYFFPTVSTIALLGSESPHPLHFFQWSTHPQSPGPITLEQIREFLKDRKERGVESHEGFVRILQILEERDRCGLEDPVAPEGKMVCVEMPKIAQREGSGNEEGSTSNMETESAVPMQRGGGGCCSIPMPDLNRVTNRASLGLDFISPELYSSEGGATERGEHWKEIGYLVKALMGQISSDDEYEEEYQTQGRSVTNRYENTGNRGGGKRGRSRNEAENVLDEGDMAYFTASLRPEYDPEMDIQHAQPEFEGAYDSWAGFTSPGYNRCSYCHIPFDELEALTSGSPASSVASVTHEDDAPSPVVGSHWDECRHASTEAQDGSQERSSDTGVRGINRHEDCLNLEGLSQYNAGMREHWDTFYPILAGSPSWQLERPPRHERTMSQDSTMSDYGIGPRETHFYATSSGIVKDDRHGEDSSPNKTGEVEERILSLCAIVQSMIRQVEATLEHNRRAHETQKISPAVRRARGEGLAEDTGTDGKSSAEQSTEEAKTSYETLLSSLQHFDPYEHTRRREISHQVLTRDPAQAFHLPSSPASPPYQSPIYLPPSPVSPPSSPFMNLETTESDTSDRYSEENVTVEGARHHSLKLKVELNDQDAPCTHCSTEAENDAEMRREIEEILKLTKNLGIQMFGGTNGADRGRIKGQRKGVESAPNTPASSNPSEPEDQLKATINSVDKGKQPVLELPVPESGRPSQGPIQPAQHVQSQPLSWDPASYIPYAGPSRPRVHRMVSTASSHEEAISPVQTCGWEEVYRREIGKGGGGKKRTGVWID